MYQILVLVFALVLFTFLAFKKVGAIPMASFVALITCILAGMPILESLLGPFMDAAGSYVKNYFFVFFLGAVFSALYEGSGGAKSIALFLCNLAHGKHIAVMLFIITAILTYGGISGFVVYFVIYPIALQMFQRNNISRILLPGVIMAGCWTVSMIAPGAPSVQNVIAMKSLGTTSTAGFIPGLVSAAFEAVLIIIWFEFRTKQLDKHGRHFEDDSLPPLPESERNFNDDPNEKRPHWAVAFIPIAIILILFNGFRLAIEISCFFGIVTAAILFYPYLRTPKTYISLFNKGALNAGSSLLNTSIICGFGGIAQHTPGFQYVVDGVLNMNISPLIFVAVGAALCAGMCGSASGGMGIAFTALKDSFVSLGVNFEYAHRIAVVASGTLDSLPHQGGQATIFAITHMTHKDGYFDIFITQLVVPAITVFAVTIPLCALGL